MDLPVQGTCRIVGSPGNCKDWEEYAKRGFYGYDWNHSKERYDLMSVPSNPLPLVNLGDSDLVAAAAAIRLDLTFKNTKRINPDNR